MNTIRTPLYLDTAASTPVDKTVAEQMVAVMLGGGFANPSSTHIPGQISANIIRQARTAIAAELVCEPDEIIFTSGATEANNLALRGVAMEHQRHGRHLITSQIEHKAILECCAALEREGFQITYVAPNPRGWVEPEAVARAIRPDTLLISLMHTNNETGIHQPIAEVAEVAKEAGVLFHADAAQAAGKFAINLSKIPIDMLSLSAHKFHGPKGSGCLIIRNRRKLRLQPLMFGGGQEFSLRPGTLAPHQVVGLSTALVLAAERRATDFEHVKALKSSFLRQLSEQLPVQVHGDPERVSPYIVSLSIQGIGSDALINQLAADLAIASGSACSSGTVEPSHVLRAMGIEGESLYGAVRISFSRDHKPDDMATAVEGIIAAVRRIRELN